MEGSKVAVVIRWKTWSRTTIEKMAKRFGFEPYVSVNRKTGALIKKGGYGFTRGMREAWNYRNIKITKNKQYHGTENKGL